MPKLGAILKKIGLGAGLTVGCGVLAVFAILAVGILLVVVAFFVVLKQPDTDATLAAIEERLGRGEVEKVLMWAELVPENARKVDSDGHTLMTIAVFHDSPEVLLKAIELEGDLHQRDTNGWPLLCHAAGQGSNQAAEILLDHDVELPDLCGDTASILIASQSGDGEMVRRFLDAGADANTVGGSGASALMLATIAAIEGRSIGAVKALLEAGADPKVAAAGRLPLDLAKAKGSDDLVALLMKNGA